MADPFAALRGISFMESRVPVLDALSAFVPEEGERDARVEAAVRQLSQSRWHPVPGGHEVLAPHEGGDYDASVFSVKERAWDHEHCKVCQERIPSMTLCWVTEEGPFVVLCEGCKRELDGTRRV